MSLDTTISLTTVEQVLSYLGIDAQQDAFWIYYSGSATTATVQVALDHLILIHDATTDKDMDLTLAAYDTIGEVVDYINEHVADWESGRICHSDSDSANLLETGQVGALGEDNEQTLKITGDYLIEQLINRASDFINRICGRMLKETTYTHERYDGGEKKIFLENWPVLAMAQVCSGKLDVIKIKYTSTTSRNAYVKVSTTGVDLIVDGTGLDEELAFDDEDYNTLLKLSNAIDGETNWEASVASSNYDSYPSSQIFKKLNRFALNQYIYLQVPDQPLDGYEIDYDNGILYLPSAFGTGWRNVFVSYDAGYASTAIPYSLEQICIELVKYKYQKRDKDSNIKSERIGKVYQYTLQDLKDALPGDLMAELEIFKSRDF